jgi:hypothetical protein
MNDDPNTQVLPTKIFDVLQSFQRTAALRAAVELDVFTAVSDRGSAADEIATHCKTSVRGMRVLCDYLCLTGLLQKRSNRYWPSEEAALYLDRRSHRFMAVDAIQVYGGGVLAEGFEHLAQAVRMGGTALPWAGTLAPEHPYWSQFARVLAPIGAANAVLLADLLDYPPSAPIRVLDIACGHGHYGIAVAKRNPLAEIFAQDWPAVLEMAVANARDAGVSQRYHAIPGDVFSANLGERYDVALITNFLPDLGPAECEQLLARIRSALANQGRAVVLQCIPGVDRLSPPNGPSLALSLLVQTPEGDVYTCQELAEMFKRAGFARTEMRELGPSANQHVMIGHRH